MRFHDHWDVTILGGSYDDKEAAQFVASSFQRSRFFIEEK